MALNERKQLETAHRLYFAGRVGSYLATVEWRDLRGLYQTLLQNGVTDVLPDELVDGDAVRMAREYLKLLKVQESDKKSAMLIAQIGLHAQPVLDAFLRNDGSGHRLTQPLNASEAAAVAGIAEETIEHTLARLFLRLGPPPETAEIDYTPAGRGGGGAQQ
jgi:hypothetical protein